MPTLALTGERELDQIISALNDAGARLAQARHRAQELSLQVTTAERLAAIGRVAAGVAHEIRNPIAAMRLKAENALAKGGERYHDALTVILDQISRLDRLLRRLLNVTEPERASVQRIALGPFMESCLAAHREAAQTCGVRLACRSTVDSASLDPELARLAIDNLLVNAIQAAPAHSLVEMTADVEGDRLILAIYDEGAGPPTAIRERLFEPFVTGRPDGTGLGLSLVRELAESHGGIAQFGSAEPAHLRNATPMATILMVDDDPSCAMRWAKQYATLGTKCAWRPPAPGAVAFGGRSHPGRLY